MRAAAQQALEALEIAIGYVESLLREFDDDDCEEADNVQRDYDTALDALEALRTALAQPEGWQPIETVPKDGTAVLVMRDIWPGTESGRAEECCGHNTYVAAWWGNEDGGGRWVCYMDATYDPTCPVDPTHWMPLPAAPSYSELTPV